MKYKFINKKNTSSLAVLFTGWGFTPEYYKDAEISCDFVVVYDYIDDFLDTSIFNGYSNIYLFGWSFGVFEAYKFFNKHETYPIVFSLAVNGTNYPIDDFKGIPKSIFNGTYENLSDRTLNKFYLRMCGGSGAYKDFLLKKPQKTISQLKDELLAVSEQSQNKIYYGNPKFKWDVAIVSDNDKIFPYSNQINGWRNNCNKKIVENGPHLYRNLISLINSRIIDKSLIKKRFSKILNSYSKEAAPQYKISKELFKRWASVNIESNKKILEIGCGTGFLTELYSELLNPSELVINDLCNIDLRLKNVKYKFIEGDAEEFITKINSKFDYILSSSAIQWFENIPLLFENLKKILNNGGYLVISTFGKRNFEQIESLTHNSLRYLSITELKNILTKDYDIFYLDDDLMTVNFTSPINVLRHLKLTGVNSIKSMNHWTKTDLENFIDRYPKIDKGICPLTYNPIYIIARLR